MKKASLICVVLALLLLTCTKDSSSPDRPLTIPGGSHLTQVKVYNYSDSFRVSQITADHAEVQDKGTRDMFFAGNTETSSYSEGSSNPNRLWADSLRANFTSETLLANGHCVLVTAEGDTFETSNLYFGQDSLASRHTTRAVFSSRAERSVVLDPGEHNLDSFVYTSSTIQLWNK